MKRSRTRRGRTLRVSLFLGSFLIYLFLYACSESPRQTEPIKSEAVETVDPGIVPVNSDADYTRFKHDEPQHERLPCLLCHVRTEKSVTPKFSGHLPCAGCHVQQFADNKSQICSICHTDAESGAMKSFPSLQNFSAKFDHGRHLGQTNCGSCHRPSQRGTALSIPDGRAAHASCFSCHGPETEIGGKNIGSCATCHEPGTPPRSRPRSAAYASGFSHNEHLMRGKTNCSSCHTVFAGGSPGRQVSAPVVAMHFPPAKGQSCGSCHNNKRAFGVGDFANCRRCHEGKNFGF